MATAEDSDALQPVSCHTVNRRYSEFLNLQTRLEEKPEVKKVIKNVKGPKKMFPDLPFGNADNDKVEAHTAVADVALNILCLLMKDQWSWLCTENIQKTIRLLFGTFIERQAELITDMLGSEKYRLSLETMLESLQDHQINKHLIYCICDLLLEFLIPESCDEAFQGFLLQSLAKDAERDNPHI
ncbi:Sorting nexin-19 [Liparis tanakae]|uniref:Sorting nexin-19 n=1 Tax=Liparis tanakae TaxID=230148 RepID=A0A4Z2I5E7_9TELE|nr:Sorting nexin-19 [Liparis tanakae]